MGSLLKVTSESNVLYINLLGNPTVILNSAEDATELLERRGAKYSDRPNFEFFEELVHVFCAFTQANIPLERAGPMFSASYGKDQNLENIAKCSKTLSLRHKFCHIEKDNSERLARPLCDWLTVLRIGYRTLSGRCSYICISCFISEYEFLVLFNS